MLMYVDDRFDEFLWTVSDVPEDADLSAGFIVRVTDGNYLAVAPNSKRSLLTEDFGEAKALVLGQPAELAV